MAKDGSVLIIDDDANVRELVHLALGSDGYRVIEAPNGAAALELLAAESPSLILLDLVMPVMDGWQFLERYRRSSLHQVPVVAVTAALPNARQGPALPVDGILAKPFELRDLFRTAEQYLAASPTPDRPNRLPSQPARPRGPAAGTRKGRPGRGRPARRRCSG